MNKAVFVIALSLSSTLFGCPDKAGDGAKQTPASAPGAPVAPAPTASTGGGGW